MCGVYMCARVHEKCVCVCVFVCLVPIIKSVCLSCPSLSVSPEMKSTVAVWHC